MMGPVRFLDQRPWIVGLAAVLVCLALFAVYYSRRRDAHTREKEDAARVFADVARRLGGRYEPVGQSRTSLYAYAQLGLIFGGTASLTYEVGCYPRPFEDVGGRLYCTVRPGGGPGVFDVSAEVASWSSRTSKRRRADLHPAIVALVEMSFEVQISPEHVRACAPPEVFDWPARRDNEAAVEWVNGVLALVDAFPRRG